MQAKSSRYDPKPYEAKILELHQKISEAAKTLQDYLEAQDSSRRETGVLIEKQARLERENNILLAAIQDHTRILDETIERKQKFVDAIKVEASKERERLREVAHSVDELNQTWIRLTPLVKEIENFISNEKEVRKRYLKANEALAVAERTYKKVSADTQQKQDELQEKNQELDGYKEYLKEMMGRITSHLGLVKESTEFLNQKLDDMGIPLTFGLPPDRITTIPFQ